MRVIFGVIVVRPGEGGLQRKRDAQIYAYLYGGAVGGEQFGEYLFVGELRKRSRVGKIVDVFSIIPT